MAIRNTVAQSIRIFDKVMKEDEMARNEVKFRDGVKFRDEVYVSSWGDLYYDILNLSGFDTVKVAKYKLVEEGEVTTTATFTPKTSTQRGAKKNG